MRFAFSFSFLEPTSNLFLRYSGGGPGGLALSIVLGKYCNDVYIDLYEAAPQFTEIGAGISVWKRTWSILQTLGLDKRLGGLAVSLPMDELSEFRYTTNICRLLMNGWDRAGFCIPKERPRGAWVLLSEEYWTVYVRLLHVL